MSYIVYTKTPDTKKIYIYSKLLLFFVFFCFLFLFFVFVCFFFTVSDTYQANKVTGGTAANLSLDILIQDSTRSVSERVGGGGGSRSFLNVL